MSQVFPSVIIPPSPGDDKGHSRRSIVRTNKEALEALKFVQDRCRLTAMEFMSSSISPSTSPWAYVFFRQDYPLAGHIAYLRGSLRNLPTCSYNRLTRLPLGGRPPPVSAMIIRRKAILRRLAHRSPLLAGIWEALRHCEEQKFWICLADDPPKEWIRKASEDDAALYRVYQSRFYIPHWDAPDMNNSRIGLLHALAQSYMAEEKWEYAEQNLLKLVAASPGWAEGWYLIGCNQHRMLRDAEAAGSFLQALTLAPNWQEARIAHGIALVKDSAFAAHPHPETVSIFRQALKADPFNEDTWKWLGYAQFVLGNTRRAISAYACELELAPHTGSKLFYLGFDLLGAKQYAEGARAYYRHVQIMPKHSMGWNNLAFANTHLGRWEEALLQCRTSLALDSRNANAWDTMGVIQAHYGQLRPAIASFSTALDLDPHVKDARYNLEVTTRMANTN